MNADIAWINRNFRGRHGWGVSHALLAGSEHDRRGAVMAKTLCGRSVRAEQVVAAGREERCVRCSALVSSD